MKRFLSIFDSGLIGELGAFSHSGTQIQNRSYALGCITSKSAPRHSASRVGNDLRLRPECAAPSTVIEAFVDGTSINSDDSGRAIIKKTQTWEVKYEDQEAIWN